MKREFEGVTTEDEPISNEKKRWSTPELFVLAADQAKDGSGADIDANYAYS